VDPTKFNPEKYPDRKVYKVSVDGHEMEKTAQDLGETLQKVYGQLIDQGMLKQDARGFLPFNVATRLMMTFTYSDLIHFFNMRIDKAAQPEVQEIAKETYELLKVHEGSDRLFELSSLKELISEVESPVYKQDDLKNQALLDDIDEPMGLPKEEIISVEDEDKKD
jgi:thymidylate synthase ThyX